jgi:hypothetical protein
VSGLGEREGFGGRGLGPRDLWERETEVMSVDDAPGLGRGRTGTSSPFKRGKPPRLVPLGDTGAECD